MGGRPRVQNSEGVRGRGHIRHHGGPTGVPADAVGGRENPSPCSHHVEDRPSGARQVRAGDGEAHHPRRRVRDTPAGGEHPDRRAGGRAHRGADGRHGGVLQPPAVPEHPVKTMNKMLQNRAYIGEYRHGDIVVEGGMPALVDEETFDKVQRKFAENKRKGSQRARGMDENDAPRYWLTGKVYCGKCGNTLQGVSGTSGTGRTYYYYYCSAQRRKQCTLKKVRKEKLEDAVTMILRSILHDSENLMSLAVDAAAYYEKNYRDTGYLDGLEAKRREVEKSLANLVKVIESGLISETVTERLVQLEEQKRALNEAIEAENIRAALCEDEHTIKAYFEKFLHADFDNPETRDQVLEYFVDKIYLTDDGLVVTSWYSEDRTEVTWDMLYGEDGNPFVKGEAVKFDCFPFGSTNRK